MSFSSDAAQHVDYQALLATISQLQTIVNLQQSTISQLEARVQTLECVWTQQPPPAVPKSMPSKGPHPSENKQGPQRRPNHSQLTSLGVPSYPLANREICCLLASTNEAQIPVLTTVMKEALSRLQLKPHILSLQELKKLAEQPQRQAFPILLIVQPYDYRIGDEIAAHQEYYELARKMSDQLFLIGMRNVAMTEDKMSLPRTLPWLVVNGFTLLIYHNNAFHDDPSFINQHGLAQLHSFLTTRGLGGCKPMTIPTKSGFATAVTGVIAGVVKR